MSLLLLVIKKILTKLGDSGNDKLQKRALV